MAQQYDWLTELLDLPNVRVILFSWLARIA
jgi:hypothetical protein